ncbi:MULTISPECIES: helix-turn-helix domain-containing protein [unclassified Streptomyces]|uniref:helix-turn-helix domain-containing protein n=1 Tax=unclassified Streptomyces TaxID=2593676 RepID=UPI003251B3E3
MTEQPRNRTQITDETGKTVAANVRRLREARGLSTYDLSRALAEAGRPIAPSAIAKVERAERRVDVGDLMALAVVLGVSPVTLLLPANARGGKDANGIPQEARTEVTGAGEVGVVSAWRWAWCQDPLQPGDPDMGEEEADRRLMDFLLNSRPIGLLSAQGDDRIMSAGIGTRRRRPDGPSVD